MTILTGSMTLVTLLGLPETYVPQLLHLKAMKLRRETGDIARNATVSVLLRCLEYYKGEFRPDHVT